MIWMSDKKSNKALFDIERVRDFKVGSLKSVTKSNIIDAEDVGKVEFGTVDHNSLKTKKSPTLLKKMKTLDWWMSNWWMPLLVVLTTAAIAWAVKKL